MFDLTISDDTSGFEVPAAFDEHGKLARDCEQLALQVLNTHGLVILTDFLSSEEADTGLQLICDTIEDPDRAQCTFASETDNRFKRRDFCSLPPSPGISTFVASLCQRLEGVVSQYCGRSHPLLEVTTLTSYFGSSHQYIHRDPSGVISAFAAVDDVSDEQGGTVFVPGTQLDGPDNQPHDPAAMELMELYRTQCNIKILLLNLKKLWNMRGSKDFPLAPGELKERVFSSTWDEHQPNLLRFTLGKNSQFSLRNLGPIKLWKLFLHHKTITQHFRLIRTAPRKGTVILYKSDLLHAGPDNRSPTPRRLFSMSLARDLIETKSWHTGYSPHPELTAKPMTLGDLLEYPASPAPSAENELKQAVLAD